VQFNPAAVDQTRTHRATILNLVACRATEFLAAVICVVSLFALPDRAFGQATVSAFGTFHSIGVSADISGDSNRNATAVPRYRPQGSGEPFKTGMKLTRVSSTRFSGSLFWLTPGVAYDIQLQFDDPDGGELDGLLRTLSASTRSEISSPIPVRRLYASPGGGNTSCLNGNPCSLAVAVDRAQAGDEVLLSAGRYYTGGLRTLRSGTASAPIVFRAAPGARAVLDGAYPSPSGWTAMGNGLYRTSVEATGTHLVMADGRRLMSYRSLADLQALYWGLSGIFVDGTTVYLKMDNGADPNGLDIAVSRYNEAFSVQHNHIRFDGLDFFHYGHDDWAKAIYINGGSNIVVQRCRFIHNDTAIALKRASSENLVQDNEFIETVENWPWDAVKDPARGDGRIETGGYTMFSPMTGRGNVVRRNTFRGHFDALRPCPGSSSGVVSETDVYENHIFRVGDDGIEADGDCTNTRIWRNRIHDVLVGVSTSPSKIGPTFVIRNLIYRTGFGNNNYPGSSFKFNNGFSDFSGPIYLFHNTVDSVLDNSNGIDLKSPGNWTGIVSRNNIYSGSDYAVRNVNTANPVNFDYDNLTTRSTQRFARWGGVEYPSLLELQGGTNQFANSVSENAAFVDPAAADYTLRPSSALVDAGTLIAGINDDYAGSAPDIGAFELTADSPGFPDTPTVLTQIQTLSNESAAIPAQPSRPWLTVAVAAADASRFSLALERSEAAAGTVVGPETVAYLAIESGRNGSFTARNGRRIGYASQITGTTIGGWSNGCANTTFPTTYTLAPVVLASKMTRNGGDGGWLRRCRLQNNLVGLTVDEDIALDVERWHTAERAGIVSFAEPFSAQFANADNSVWQLEAGRQQLPETFSQSSFARVTFSEPHQRAPLVFVLASSEGSDPTALRINNVNTTGFDVVQVEPDGTDGEHIAMQIHYLAVTPGEHRLPDGTRLTGRRTQVSAVQHGAGVAGETGWRRAEY